MRSEPKKTTSDGPSGARLMLLPGLRERGAVRGAEVFDERLAVRHDNTGMVRRRRWGNRA